MNVKEAVEIAKKYVSDLFATEQIRNVGLEEVDFDEDKNTWYVTIGFSRPWDNQRSVNALAASLGLNESRSYKVVRIADNDGRVLSVKAKQAA